MYQALNVPISRLQQQAGLNFGRAAEITRDELKFTKFVGKLRRQFSLMFADLLKTQLILKGIITEQDWVQMADDVEYVFAQDAYYTESKEQEILRSRVELIAQVDPYLNKYVSKSYIQKKIMRLSEEEISDMDSEMKADLAANPPIESTEPPTQ